MTGSIVNHKLNQTVTQDTLYIFCSYVTMNIVSSQTIFQGIFQKKLA